MKFSILNKLALKSIVANKRIYFPYLLAISLLFSLEYILLSLMQNDYVSEFHPDLLQIVGIGVFFSTLLIIIISLYTSNFIQENQTKEFSLYTVLGLEKKHIRTIMFIQMVFNWAVTSILSIVLGYLSGSLMFIGLNRLMQDAGASLMDYPFQLQTAIGIVLLLFGTFFVSFIIHIIKIGRLNPMELLRSAHKGQAEPKGRLWIVILGLISLGSGYYIALTTNDVLGSLLYIFIAIFLIIIGTYLLFLSLSIIILKAIQKNKNIYYKPNNFLSISGMLHRMGNNAVSLASIAILCSGVILVLGLTTTLFRVMETQIANSMPTEYSVQPFLNNKEENEAYLDNLVEEIENLGDVQDTMVHSQISTNGYLLDSSLIPLTVEDSAGQNIVLLGETIEMYNAFHDESIQLEDDEVAITSNLVDVDDFSTIELNGEMYETKIVSDDAISSNYGVEVIYLAFANEEQLESFRNNYQTFGGYEQEYSAPSYQTVLYFNVAGDEVAIQNRLEELEERDPLRVNHIDELSQSMYTLYGGLLFIGLVVSIVLITGTILMLYFKQITEGHQDRENFKIMKRVGLADSMIKKTIRSQIVWIFALPIAVAILHNIFVAKIVYTLVGLFGVRDISVFVTSYFGVLVLFVLVYFVFYRLTSITYYNIINE